MGISPDTALAVAIGFIGYSILFVIVAATVGAAFGVGVERIQLGLGPAARVFRIGKTSIQVSPLLLNSHVKFAAKDDDAPFARWPIRALIAVCGPITALGTCTLALGTRTLDEALLAWPQMYAAVTDFATPLDLNAALHPSFEAGGMIGAASVVAVKMAMFNLLPLPILNGGAFLFALVEGLTGKHVEHRLPQPVLLLSLSLLVAFVVLLLWRIVVGT